MNKLNITTVAWILALLLLTSLDAMAQNGVGIPMNFRPEQNNVTFASPVINYEVDDSGTLIFNRTLTRTQTFVLSYSHKYGIRCQWPGSLIDSGTLVIFDEKNNELWSKQIEKSESNVTQSKLTNSDLERVGSFVVDVKPDALMGSAQSIHFCLTKQVGKQYTKICSPNFGFKRKNNEFEVEPSVASAQVYVDKKMITNKGTVYLNQKDDIEFKAQFHNGAFIEAVISAPNFEIADVVASSGNKQLKIKMIDKSSDLESTAIVDMSGGEKGYLPLKSAAGIVLDQEIVISDAVPSDKFRVFLPSGTLVKTYQREIDTEVIVNQALQISSTQQNGVVVKKMAADRASLEVADLRQGEWTTGTVTLLDGKNQMVASTKFYRGFPFEVSGFVSLDGSNVFGGFGISGWAEDLWLDKQNWIKQRFGFDFTRVGLPEIGGDKQGLTISDAGLMINLWSGVYDSDNTFGLKFVARTFDVTEIESCYGAGVYGSWQLPAIFALLFDWFFLFRYPKWVHIEAISFSGDNFESTYTAKIAGRLFFRPALFMEGSLVVNNIQYEVPGYGIDYSPFFAGLGFGYKF